MKKKYVVFIITAVLLTSLIAVSVILFINDQRKDETISYQGSAYLDGKLITKNNVTIHCRQKNNSYATLPFLEVLTKLNFSVEWQDDNTAKIGYEDKYYILSLNEKTNPTLTKIDDDKNLLVPAPGADCRYLEIIEKDVIMDDISIQSALMFMGIDLRSDLDMDTRSINFKIHS